MCTTNTRPSRILQISVRQLATGEEKGIYLRGRDPEREYRFASISGATSNGNPTVASGSYWISYGVDVELRGDLQAAVFKLEAAK